MRKSRFTETQIVGILAEQDAGAGTLELSRKHGIHPNTLRAWRAKYGGVDSAGVARLRQLEDENARLRRVVANLTLDVDALKAVLQKNFQGPQRAKSR